jgi:hypothetical protein
LFLGRPIPQFIASFFTQTRVRTEVIFSLVLSVINSDFSVIDHKIIGVLSTETVSVQSETALR